MITTKEGINFPKSALDYLRRHKPGAEDLQKLCDRQADRAIKQIDELQEFLIDRPFRKIIDLGCGLGVVDALLAREGRNARNLLIDGDGTVDRHGEYRKESIPWNDVRVAREFVAANRKNDAWFIAEHMTTEPSFPWTSIKAEHRETDVLMSLKSWGLHYPVNTYLDMAMNICKPGTVLILDLHKPAGRVELERAGFRFLRAVGNYDEPGAALLPFVRHVFERA